MLTKNPTGPLTVPRCVVARIADISTGETIYLMLPKCRVTKIWTVLSGTIAGSTAVLTPSRIAAAITDGVVNVLIGGAGQIAFSVPSANNEFDGVSHYLKIVNGGQSTNTVSVLVTVEYELL